ncbi:MAG: transporter, partial [Bradyrhizobiaceae bacterium]|nr:transporter [Bradyrhizobiaceae bacterium]
MRLLAPAALIGLASLTLLVSAALAQCPREQDPIATDRPDVTNSSLVLPPGSFQSENGINVSQFKGGHTLDATNSRLRFGVAPCWEILVDVPTYVRAVNGALSSGFTNVTPALKWQISSIRGKVDLSATLGAALPTGTKSIAGGGMQPYVQVPWSWALGGGWGVNGMLTSFFAPADPVNKQTT